MDRFRFKIPGLFPSKSPDLTSHSDLMLLFSALWLLDVYMLSIAGTNVIFRGAVTLEEQHLVT